uniref:Uncharacterized protein n=1 Tax=Anguilla anguilla TaxID=7936 RepID=A0A0E9WMC9_ANGAN
MRVPEPPSRLKDFVQSKSKIVNILIFHYLPLCYHLYFHICSERHIAVTLVF